MQRALDTSFDFSLWARLAGTLLLLLGFASISSLSGMQGNGFLLSYRYRPGPVLLVLLLLLYVFSIIRRKHDLGYLLVSILYIFAIVSETALREFSWNVWIITGTCVTVFGFSFFYLFSPRRWFEWLSYCLVGSYIVSVFWYNGFLLTQIMYFFHSGFTQ